MPLIIRHSAYRQAPLIDRLSHHHEQFNYIRPFHEGNGRAQRVFWNRIARDAGWQLDWRTVRGWVNDHASRVAAEQRDFSPLHAMFDQVVSKAAPGGERNEDGVPPSVRACLSNTGHPGNDLDVPVPSFGVPRAVMPQRRSVNTPRSSG